MCIRAPSQDSETCCTAALSLCLSLVVARHFKDAGANMVGHWPADDYQHEDSKVLIVVSQSPAAGWITYIIDFGSRLGKGISMWSRHATHHLLCLPRVGAAKV